MCILPLQCGQFVYFGLVGSHNKFCTSHMLINLFHIHTKQCTIEVERVKNGMLLSAIFSFLMQRLDVQITWRSKLAHQKHGRLFMDVYVCSPNTSILSVFAICVWPSNRCSQCLNKASRSFVETPRSRIKNWFSQICGIWRQTELGLASPLNLRYTDILCH